MPTMLAVFRLISIIIVATQSGCLADPSAVSSRRQALADAQADSPQRDAGGQCSGAITYAGCCVDSVLVYCAGGELVAEACQQECGWSSSYGFYLCGPSAGADPSGQLPRACPDADGGVPDGLLDGPVDGGLSEGGADQGSCGPLSYVGCCDGDQLVFCSGGQLLSLACKPGTCGWNSEGEFYDCDTDGAVDPKFPKACDGVLGDASVPVDGGDAGQSDQFTDAVVDVGQPSDAPPSDGFAVVDAPPKPDLTDSVSPDVVGFDALGLDASRFDGGIVDGEANGCSCEAANSASLTPILLLTLFVTAARRRRKEEGEQTWRSR